MMTPTRGTQRIQHARSALRASWNVVRDIAHGIDSWSAVTHGVERSPAPRRDVAGR
jgi:hypothetical protein